MKIHMSIETAELLREMLKEKNKKAIRILYKGFGCGGVTLGVMADEKRAEDSLYDIHGLSIILERDIEESYEEVRILYSKTPFGPKFHIALPREKPAEGI
ncbi:hypothetical protein ACPWSR_04515 [Alloiococcus sp. CFN-8]|uniref:hypothetical protein n=1 Tax=Alloiococcus sp. CFN-8 TaxID=3416081 RepID=UPI003CF89AB3